jgi:hypothetical protein
MRMNKHLLKIITEYIDYKLKYVDELENITIRIYNDVSRWQYHTDYAMYNVQFVQNYKYLGKFRIRRKKNNCWDVWD